MNTRHSCTACTVLAAVLAVATPFAQAQQLPVTPSSQPGATPHRPPPEAYQACVGKSAGSKAEFANPRGETVTGYCENEGNGTMVLRPDRSTSGGTTGGHRGPPPEAYQACVGKASGSRAQFTSPRGDTVSGTCEREGERLVLRPDRPPRGNSGDQPGQ